MHFSICASKDSDFASSYGDVVFSVIDIPECLQVFATKNRQTCGGAFKTRCILLFGFHINHNTDRKCKEHAD